MCGKIVDILDFKCVPVGNWQKKYEEMWKVNILKVKCDPVKKCEKICRKLNYSESQMCSRVKLVKNI